MATILITQNDGLWNVYKDDNLIFTTNDEALARAIQNKYRAGNTSALLKAVTDQQSATDAP